MPTTNTSDKIIHDLGIGQHKTTVIDLPISTYNPETTFIRDNSGPYTLTITEKTYSWIRKGDIILKTVIEYDAPYPYGNVIKINKQEEVVV